MNSCPVQVDPLIVVSELSLNEISEICKAFGQGLQGVLQQNVDILKQSLQAMHLKSKSDTSSSSPKFEICAINAGSIDDFHEGLAGRIGTDISNFSGRSCLRCLTHKCCRFSKCGIFERHGNGT